MYNNILYGDLSKTADDVFDAARMANIHDTIVNRFPKQYNTEVGERGLKLSGICIACFKRFNSKTEFETIID